MYDNTCGFLGGYYDPPENDNSDDEVCPHCDNVLVGECLAFHHYGDLIGCGECVRVIVTGGECKSFEGDYAVGYFQDEKYIGCDICVSTSLYDRKGRLIGGELAKA